MEELDFTGNCLKGSRPVLSFDASFDKQAHLRVIKELLQHTFGVPKTSRKTKPFVDHVMSFTVADGKIWIRCYEISESERSSHEKAINSQDPNGEGQLSDGDKKSDHQIKLIEIGPRFVLTPIVILESSFGGPVIYENKEFVSPNQIRADLRRSRAGKFNQRSEVNRERIIKKRELGLSTDGERLPRDALDEKDLFK